MTAINFSSRGARWRVLPIVNDAMRHEHTPPLPGTGLLFLSADGELRFLALEVALIPTLELLQAKSNAELGSLVESAKPLN